VIEQATELLTPTTLWNIQIHSQILPGKVKKGTPYRYDEIEAPLTVEVTGQPHGSGQD
jgi:hypothetical protein